MIRTLLLPGLDGSAAPHWQHWWERMDPTARIVDQKCWHRPRADQWLTEIAGALLLHPGAVLVAHSLGAAGGNAIFAFCGTRPGSLVSRKGRPLGNTKQSPATYRIVDAVHQPATARHDRIAFDAVGAEVEMQ